MDQESSRWINHELTLMTCAPIAVLAQFVFGHQIRIGSI